MKLFQRHVGRHQEQLCLFALPSIDTDDEGEDDDDDDDGEDGDLSTQGTDREDAGTIEVLHSDENVGAVPISDNSDDSRSLVIESIEPPSEMASAPANADHFAMTQTETARTNIPVSQPDETEGRRRFATEKDLERVLQDAMREEEHRSRGDESTSTIPPENEFGAPFAGIRRTKTRKWIDARPEDYDGASWGSLTSDEYDAATEVK